jgi:2-hydroxychromene-2-carboxylate isomerase
MKLRDRLERRVLPRAVVTLSTVDAPRRWVAALRRATGRPGVVELYVALDDPYSAIAVLGVVARTAARRVDLRIHAVVERGIPGDPAAKQKRAYAVTDARRLAPGALGLELARADPLRPEATAFLADWIGQVKASERTVGFCAAAMRRLWFEDDADVSREPYVALWREHVGGDPPAGASTLGAERRMRRRRLYDTPVAVVGGRWFFAHERQECMSRRPIDFFFSFRSPYSYIAAPRAFALGDRYDIEVVFRGVIPMAMRGQAVPAAKRLHTLRDVKREAQRLGMPFGRVHDPLGPGAMRCLVVAEHAAERGRVREFVLEASRAIWAEAVDVSTDRGLRRVCDRVGLDWRECQLALADARLRERVYANTRAVDELGHWGVPLLVVDGDVFWGQDRIEDVERLLGGAELRSAS